MHHFIFSRGPIKLYPLPGTEEYVAKVARWLAGNLLKEAEKQKAGTVLIQMFMNISILREQKTTSK